MACRTTHPCRDRNAVLPGMGMAVGQVICGRMMLGVVVGKVGGPAGPIETKLGLGLSAAEPMEAEPNHFSVPLDDGVVKETSGGRISVWSGEAG